MNNINGHMEVFKNCKQFMRIINDLEGFQLLRGYKHGTSNFFKKSVRKDRRPSDTNKLVHDVMDELFYKKFKVKARSECLFVTGDYKFARGYGKTYIIYPIGPFKFYWNPDIEDLYADLPSAAYKKAPTREELIITLEPIIKKYKSSGLKGAIRSGNEIMLDCKEYYAELRE